MRIVVLSDSHGAKGKLFDIVQMHIDDADLFIFLGDGERDWDYILEEFPNIKYKAVAGNCDWGSNLPLYQTMKFGGKNILYTHGHPFYVKHGYNDIIRECKSNEIELCLFGHTHLQYSEYIDGLYLFNPGSVADGNYGMIDIVNGQIVPITAKL